MDRLSPEKEPDVSVRRALLLALAEFDQNQLRPDEREVWVVPRLLVLYRDEPDAGIHGAAGWLLRQWGQQAKVEKIDRELATGKAEGSGGGTSTARGRRWCSCRPGSSRRTIGLL
jgi:hypothetical protein